MKKGKSNTKGSKSSVRDKFKKQKESLAKHHQEQVDSKEDKNFPTIFNKDAIPEGIEFWKCGKGDHIIDIIPFFAGDNHPKVSKDELAYVLDIWVHRGIGPMKEPFVCQTKNFKKSDPICEYISANRLPVEEWKKISPKRRTVYLVWVHDTPEEEAKGVQIWEVAHFFFESHIDEIAKNPKGGGAIAFSDIDSGKQIAFSVKSQGKYKDDNGSERESLIYVGHRFIDRDDPIPDYILDQIFPLDDAVRMKPDLDVMRQAFYGDNDFCESKKESRLDRLKKNNKWQEEEEDEADYDDEDALDESLGPDEDKDDEEEEEKEVKKPKKSGKGKKKPEPEPEEDEPFDSDDEDEDEDEDEEESEEETCPVNDFGTGLDKHKECKKCNIWDDCSDENEKLEKAKKSGKKSGKKKK